MTNQLLRDDERLVILHYHGHSGLDSGVFLYAATPSSVDVEADLRTIARDYVATLTKDELYDLTVFDCFNWGDLAARVPNDFLAGYGLRRLDWSSVEHVVIDHDACLAYEEHAKA
jgi:hypothetical protein